MYSHYLSMGKNISKKPTNRIGDRMKRMKLYLISSETHRLSGEKCKTYHIQAKNKRGAIKRYNTIETDNEKYYTIYECKKLCDNIENLIL